MVWFGWMKRRLRILCRRDKVEDELVDEVALHVEMETEQLQRQGWPPEDARREALRRLGGVERTKEWVRAERAGQMLDALMKDVRHAQRGLRRRPGFTICAVLVLAGRPRSRRRVRHGSPPPSWACSPPATPLPRRGGIGVVGAEAVLKLRVLRHPRGPVRRVQVRAALGIGANAAVFSVVNSMLLKPLPYADPERVVSVYQDSDDGAPRSSSFPATRDMATYTEVFSGVAAMSATTMTWEADDGPRSAFIEFVTSSYFPVLGIAPSAGRWFDAAYDLVGAGNYAVVSHRTWRTQFGADPKVIGRTVRMGGQPVTVIGVGPEGFNGSYGLVTDFWLSISSAGVGGPFRVANLERRQDHWYDARARLAPGVTLAQAQGAMDALAARLADEFPVLNRGRGITVFGGGQVRVHPAIDGALVSAAGLLLVIVGLVLALACANLANLLIVRGIFRGPEMALRRALGATRGRVARLFLTESILLALLGGGFGMLLGWWALRLIPVVAGSVTATFGGTGNLDIPMDLTVLIYTVTLSLATGVLFGLAPALRSSRSDVAGVLRVEGQSVSPDRRAALLRNGLVVVQLAVCLVLVVGAGLLTRSLANVLRVDPGVDAERLAFVATSFTQGAVTPEEQTVRLQDLMARAAALPGVTSVAYTSRLPVEPGGSTTTVIDGYTPPTGTDSVELPLAVVSDDYFRTVGLRVVAGRTFGPPDALNTAPVVVINRTAATRFWGDADPVGRRIRPQAAPDFWIQVIGVVEDAKVASLDERPTPMLFYPVSQIPGAGYVVARTEGNPGALLSGLRVQLRAVSPDLPLSALGTLDTRLADSLVLHKASAAILGLVSVLAVLLASLGIYAVVSFSVARRASEIGIRIALGAERSQVIGLVMREMLATVLLGLAVGASVALPAASSLASGLYGVSTVDAASLGLASALLLVAVATLAIYIPARRAAGANAVATLRAQ